MKTRVVCVLLSQALLAILNLQSFTAFAQGTAFTYQGRLNDDGGPAAGRYDFRFRIAADADGNSYIGSAVLTNGVSTADGLFTVTLDFGTGIFTGSNYWLQIEVRTNGPGGYTVLSPLQQINATPYAIAAGSLTSGGLASGTYTNAVAFNNAANQFTGSYSGNGSGLTSVNAAMLGGVSASSFWKLGGNTLGASQVFGSIDNQAVDFRVGNLRAFRLQPNIASNAPNVIGGSSWNYVSNGVVGATIGGGGGIGVSTDDYYEYPSTNALTNVVFAMYGTVSGGGQNATHGEYGTVGGGMGSDASGAYSTVGGGHQNKAGGRSSTVAGGVYNNAGAKWSSVGGGFQNIISTNALSATIGGGDYNSAQGIDSTVPGGYANVAKGRGAFAAGEIAQANHDGAFVWADQQGFTFASTTANQFRVRAGGGMEIVGGTGQPALHYSGTRTGGFGTPVGLAENLNTSGQSAPALRVSVAGGDAIDGALSVSANGTGYIARFGNSSTWVADLTTGGTLSAVTFNTTSDRNAKENFSSVDSRAILEKVVALPISRWDFKVNGNSDHIGPMAQDFHAAFGLNGADDKHIATVDADGVALAAIQGLNQKLEQKETEIAELKARLEKLEQLINQKKENNQ